jgi:nitrite reductase/ring-hydroxylating ferredoxin subunit/uncharacterized membrane protein
MRSKGSYNGHPLHPALIPFPFAFLVGAFVFDVLTWLLTRPAWWQTGGHLAAAGILMAVVAAVPGLVDYVYSVPPQSSGKQRATRHAILNLSAVGLFAIAWAMRNASGVLFVLALEFLAVAMLSVGAWLGGILVSRNQISVDHRYANAGKWRESVIAADTPPIRVASVDELKVDQMKLLRVAGRRIVLARSDRGYVAFEDRCTHRGGSLAGGTMICGTVQCPWHGSQFDAHTGVVKAGPATQAIATYATMVRDGEIFLSSTTPQRQGTA